nr:unnamed protein product [Callosobruchus chinensis]
MIFIWTPGDVGIAGNEGAGNEGADHAAKLGDTANYDNIPVGLKGVKILIKRQRETVETRMDQRTIPPLLN